MIQYIKLQVRKITMFFLALIFCINLLHSQVIQLFPRDDLQASIDAINTNDMKEDIIIELAEGRYELSQTLKFTNEQSGKNGYRVIVKSAPGQLAKISGGTKITGWTFYNADKKIIKAPVNNEFLFRQLYVNEKKVQRSEHSTNGTTFVNAVCELYSLNGSEHVAFKVSRNELIEKSIPQSLTPWNNLDQVEIRFHTTYRKHKVRIKSMRQHGDYYYFLMPADVSEIIKNNNTLLKKPHKYDISFENALEFIDSPGEWYLDEKNHEVYYKLNDGETIDNIEIMAPKLDKLLDIDGTDNLTFFGLLFEHSTWLYPTEAGHVLTEESFYLRGSWQDQKKVPGAIFIQDADNLVFERNIIRYTGGAGIDVDDEFPVENLQIIGNVFYKTASTAINLCRKRFHPPTTHGKSGVYQPLISNNYFYEAAFEYGNNVFAAHYAYQLDFSHNEIFKCTNMAVGLGHGSSVGNLYRYNAKYNKFDSCGMEGTDTGVFHTKFQSGGSRIIENWFNNSVKVITGRGLGAYYNSINDPFFGNIYIDNFAKDITCKGNVHSNLTWNGYQDRMQTNDMGYEYGFEQGKHIYWGVGTTGTHVPNYIIDDYLTANPSVEANAGLTEKYADIKNFAIPYPGSIAGSKSPSEMEYVSVLIDDRDGNSPYFTIAYTGADGQGQGSWTNEKIEGTNLAEGAYLDTYTSSTSTGDELCIRFHGTAIDVLAPQNTSQSVMDVYLDGKLDTTVNLYSINRSWQQVVYRVQNLPKGEHKLVVKKKEGSGSKLILDGFEIKLSVTALIADIVYPKTGNLNVDQKDSLLLSFNENVTPAKGKYIKIYTDTGTLFESIDASSTQVMVNGGLVKIIPSGLLEKNSYYYVLIDYGAFSDEVGNNFMGISEFGLWNFATLNENIALNKPSKASGIFNENNGTANGNDGDLYNLWSSGAVTSGTNAWWQVDLNEVFRINNIEIVSRQNMDQEFARKNFRILGSNSNNFSSYEVLASHGETPFADKGTWKKSITNNSGFRYLRVEKTDTSPMNFAEFRAYGELATITTIEAPRFDNVRSKIIIYPNPTTNMLCVESDSRMISIMVFDMNGRILIKKKCTDRTENISLDNVSPGIYLLKVLDVNGLKKGTIVKL
jgi:hypothetical protein